MMDLSHAGHPALIPGPFWQCMTLIARETLVQNFKIRGGTYVQIFPGFVHMFGCFGHHLWV